MWGRSILSPHTGPADVTRNRLSRSAPPAQARYIRDANGKCKYFARVDVQDVPRDKLVVYVQHNLVILFARLENRAIAGGRRTHEWRRELRIPSDVNVSSLRCKIVEPGYVHIEADVLGQKLLFTPTANIRRSRTPDNKTTYPNYWNRSPTPTLRHSPLLQRPDYRIDHRRVTFAEPESFRRSLSRNPITPLFRAVPIREWNYGRSSPISVNSPPTLRKCPSPQLHANPIPGHRTPTPTAPNNPSWPVRIREIPFHGDVTTSSTQGQRRYKLRVELGHPINPRDLTINSRDGLLTIHAKTKIKGNSWSSGEDMVFEHYSEHTLPSEVIQTNVSARLQDGVVYVEAPFKPVSRTMHLPRAANLNRQSMVVNNWPVF